MAIAHEKFILLIWGQELTSRLVSVSSKLIFTIVGMCK